MDTYSFHAVTNDGQDVHLEQYRGSVSLIVNVASHCGFTSQYAGLQALYEEYHARGFVVLGFPCNQFGGQEPGSDEEIKSFCETKYRVSFPLFRKIEVNGAGEHPLYRYLKEAAPGLLGSEAIKWNFTKFLVGRSGEVVDRYSPTMGPAALKGHIEQQLKS